MVNATVMQISHWIILSTMSVKSYLDKYFYFEKKTNKQPINVYYYKLSTYISQHPLTLIRRLYCVKSFQIRSFFWSVFSRIRTEYRENLLIQSECGKIRTKKTPYLDSFYALLYTTLSCKSTCYLSLKLQQIKMQMGYFLKASNIS